MNKRSATSTAIGFALLVLICVGINLLSLNKYKSYISTEATVVDAYKIADDDYSGDSRSYAMYEFEHEGNTVTAQKRVFSRFAHKVGSVETIRFDPADPQKLENTHSRLFYWLCAGGGIALAIAFFFSAQKPKQKSR